MNQCPQELQLAGPVVELGLARVRKQMRWRERSKMRIGVKHPTHQLCALQLGHLGNSERVEGGRIRLFLRHLNGPTERLLENAKGCSPSSPTGSPKHPIDLAGEAVAVGAIVLDRRLRQKRELGRLGRKHAGLSPAQV